MSGQWQGRFFRRVFTRLALLLSIGLLTVCGITWQLTHSWAREYTADQLAKSMGLVQLAISARWPFESSEGLAAECRRIHDQSNLRITIIDLTGTVLADSDTDAHAMENHSGRPEIVQAIKGGIGRDERHSASVGRPFMYVAMPILREGKVSAIVRTAAPIEDITTRENALVQWIALVLVASLSISLVTAWLLARALAGPIQRVSSWAHDLATGDLDTHVRVREQDEVGQVAASLERMRSILAQRVSEVQQQRQNLEVTMTHLEEGVVAADAAGRVLMVNAAALRMLGAPGEMVGAELRSQLGTSPLGRMWEEAMRSDEPELRRELRLPRAESESDQAVDVSITRVRGTDTPIEWLMCLRDITELAKSVAIKTDFVANASHELRTPVASIRAAVDTLREDGLDRQMRDRFISIIDRNVERLQLLTEDLMHLNRVESASVELTMSRFRVEEVIDSLTTSFAQAFELKKAEFVAHTEVEELNSDRRWLEIVLRNLIDNAVKFVGENGRVDMKCRRVGEAAQFEVTDNGCGIPSPDVERVFERFYQVDKSRALNVGGTGLGLAIVKHAVHAMGGEVFITSEVDRGTTVRFTVPASVPREQFAVV
jgi:two-component system phosphate regulon sensor histidine kinase PhoR